MSKIPKIYVDWKDGEREPKFIGVFEDENEDCSTRETKECKLKEQDYNVDEKVRVGTKDVEVTTNRKPIPEMTVSEIFTELDDSQKDDLYRMLWSDKVYEDVECELKEFDNAPEDEDERYEIIMDVVNDIVYNGRFNQEITYWDNIISLIEEHL